MHIAIKKYSQGCKKFVKLIDSNTHHSLVFLDTDVETDRDCEIFKDAFLRALRLDAYYYYWYTEEKTVEDHSDDLYMWQRFVASNDYRLIVESTFPFILDRMS